MNPAVVEDLCVCVSVKQDVLVVVIFVVGFRNRMCSPLVDPEERLLKVLLLRIQKQHKSISIHSIGIPRTRSLIKSIRVPKQRSGLPVPVRRASLQQLSGRG